LDPNWVTGFSDVEGCFSVIISITIALKCNVRVSYEINLHTKDIDILHKITRGAVPPPGTRGASPGDFFGVGSVYSRPDRKISVFRITQVKDLIAVVIPHFSKYPLLSRKRGDFILWSKVVAMMDQKEHLTLNGFLTILSYYAAINIGVSPKIAQYYPDIKPFNRPVFELPNNLNPYWVSGFVAGDGGFSIGVRPPKSGSSYEKVDFRFFITQHSKDVNLMNLFITFFDSGTVYVRSDKFTSRCDFIIQDLNSIMTKVIPHFDLFPLGNFKQLDYLAFKEAMTIVNSNQHLSSQGLDRIRELKSGMNSGRS